MLRERNEQIDMLEILLPFQIADLSPELQAVSDFLDDHPHILSEFTAAMIKRSANSKTRGRPTESAEAVFRMLLLRRMQSLTFRQTHDMVTDSLALRQFTRIYYEAVPTYSTLCKYDSLLSDDVLKKINRHIVQGAKDLKITRGAKMRVDSTVVEAARVHRQLQQFLPLVEKVIDQATRRVLQDEQLPSDEKILSLFQPDAYVIRKGKRAKPTEFGKLVEIQQVDGKIISDWEIHDSNVSDADRFIPAVEQHIQTFGKPPNLAAGDRGYSSKVNESRAAELGVKRVCLPKKGKKSKERAAYEKQRWFKSGHRFRAGIEGTISVLKRRHGFDRCRNHGDNAYDRWVGLGIIAYNLKTIAAS